MKYKIMKSSLYHAAKLKKDSIYCLFTDLPLQIDGWRFFKNRTLGEKNMWQPEAMFII